MGKNLAAKRLEVCSQLWRAGIKAETLYVDNPKPQKTFDYAFDNGIPLILIIGESELERGVYKVRLLNENCEVEFEASKLAEYVTDLVAKHPKLLAKDQIGEEKKSGEGK